MKCYALGWGAVVCTHVDVRCTSFGVTFPLSHSKCSISTGIYCINVYSFSNMSHKVIKLFQIQFVYITVFHICTTEPRLLRTSTNVVGCRFECEFICQIVNRNMVFPKLHAHMNWRGRDKKKKMRMTALYWSWLRINAVHNAICMMLCWHVCTCGGSGHMLHELVWITFGV